MVTVFSSGVRDRIEERLESRIEEMLKSRVLEKQN